MNSKSQYKEQEAHDYKSVRSWSHVIATEHFTYKKTLRNVLNSGEIKDKDNFSVLDLACGTGYYSRLFREFTKGEIIGIDISQEMINEARLEQIKGLNQELIEYIKGDCFADLSKMLNGKKFDIVNACWLYNYCENENILKSALKNVSSVLKENGYFIGVTTSYKITPGNWKNFVPFGHTQIPKNRNFNRDKFDNGEITQFVLFEPNKFVEPSQFQIDNYYYDEKCYRSAFEEANYINLIFYDLEIDPDQYKEQYEKILINGMIFTAKMKQ